MKGRTSLTVLIFAAVTLIAHSAAGALSVQIIDEEYHISGNYNSMGPSDSFNIISVTPVSNSVILDATTHALASASPFAIYVDTSAGLYNDPEYGWIETTSFAFVDALWTFIPLDTHLDFVCNVETDLYYNDPLPYVLITDTTAGTDILNMSYETCTNGSLQTWYDLAVDPSHEYTLHMHMSSTADVDGPWFATIGAVPIPEPSTLALLLSALPMLPLLRRFRHF